MSELKRILLVEDDLNDAELTLAAFGDDYLAKEVVVARDGVEALDFLYQRGKFQGRENGNPAVVMLDIKLPKLNGLEVLQRIKSDPRLHTIPVVMLTSSREEPDLAKSYELGVNGYVVKPVEFEQFAAAIKQVGAFWAKLNEPPPGTASRMK